MGALRFAQLGCSVGRVCFELADVFAETVGFDQTARRIQHAVRLQEGATARYVTALVRRAVPCRAFTAFFFLCFAFDRALFAICRFLQICRFAGWVAWRAGRAVVVVVVALWGCS